MTRVPSSLLSRSPTGVLHFALVPPSSTDAGSIILAVSFTDRGTACRPRAALVALPSTNAGTGRMTVGYRHHFALVPPSSTDAVFIIHAVSFTNRGTSSRPRAALVALPSTNAKGKKRMTVGSRHHFALVPPSSTDSGSIILAVSFTNWGITIIPPSCRPRCAAVNQFEYHHPVPSFLRSVAVIIHREIRHFTSLDHARGT